jgi:hypothetical protein
MGQMFDGELPDLGTAPTCKTCASERVAKDAWACWNPSTGLWELESVFDQEFCHVCESETSFIWKRVEQVPSRRIRELNDAFRRESKGVGSVVVTVGVKAMGIDFMAEALAMTRSASDFSANNDPWGEHDCGALSVAGQPVFWKIDYYDLTLTAASENPGNEGVTHRVLTIMLASEY